MTDSVRGRCLLVLEMVYHPSAHKPPSQTALKGRKCIVIIGWPWDLVDLLVYLDSVLSAYVAGLQGERVL